MKPIGSPQDRPIVLIHPPSLRRRFLPTRFLPHGMAVVYASLAGLDLPVTQYDFFMDSLYAAPDGLDVHGRDRDLAEAEYRAFLATGTGSPRLAAFSEKYLDRLPGEAALYAFSVVSYHQFLAARLLAAVLRRRQPRAITVFGGPFVTVKPLSAFRDVAEADFWIKGDGREGLAGLYHWTRGGPFPGEAPGLCCLAPGRDVANPKAASPVSTEPPPDFTGLGLRDYGYDHPLLGPDTLFLPYRPDRFGLANLRPLPVGMFERERFAYDIAGGPDHAAITARHAAHRARLAPILESIEGRLLPQDQPRTAVLRDLM